MLEHEIAAALGAQFLVCGSVQRAGHRVRINVRLIAGARGINLRGHRYDRELEDVFEVQNEITATVVSTLAGRVEEAQLARARAIERDPGYAVAPAWLACGLGQAMVFQLDEHAKLVDQSQSTARLPFD